MAFNKLNLGVKIPCVQGGYSPHLVTYATQISPRELRSIIGYDPRSDNWANLPVDLQEIYKFLQRETTAARRDSIAGYIEERIGPQASYIGGFPAISIAVKNPTVFHPYEGGESALGYIDFDLESTNTRIVIDGLGRLSGALACPTDIANAFALPVTFFVPTETHGPLSIDEMGQLFHDFNFRVSQVKKSLAIALDQSDIYIRLTNALAKLPVISDNGGMARRKPSLGKGDTELVVQQVLLRAVRGAMEGSAFQESNLTEAETPNLMPATFDQHLANLGAFFTTFATAMGEGRFKQHQSLHLSSPGWQAIGVMFHEIYHDPKIDPARRERLTVELAGIDWSRDNPEWLASGLVINGTNKKGKATQSFATAGGRSTRHKLQDFLRAKIGLTTTSMPQAAE